MDLRRGATDTGPLTVVVRGIQIGKLGAVVRKPALLRCKVILAGIGPVEDKPVFELAQLGGPAPELEQGTGQVLLPDLLAGEFDWQCDLDQGRGRSVVNRAVVLEHLAGDDLGAGRQRAVDGEKRTGHPDALPRLEDFFANPIPLRFGPANLGIAVIHYRSPSTGVRSGSWRNESSVRSAAASRSSGWSRPSVNRS